MNKKLKKAFSLLTVFCMIMGMLCAPAFGMETDSPYWKITREVDGATQTITHAVLDSNGNLVNIGAEPGALGTGNLEPGTMTAQKFGAFEDADDAAKGIVKLTFDVAGKPVEVPGPLDVVIIADESGSLNMYGRSEQNVRLSENKNSGPQNIRTSASYMPCLNGEHAYLAGDLQRELYQIALARLTAAAGVVDEDLAAAVAEALNAEDQEGALAALLTEEIDAAAAAETALEEANAALIAADEAHVPFAEAVKAAADAVTTAELALEEAKGALAEEAAAVAAAQSAVLAAQADKTAAEEALANAQEEAAINEAQEAVNAAIAALETANTDLAAANTAYSEAYNANEAIAAAEASLEEARTAYNEEVEAAQQTADAAAEAKTAVERAAASIEETKAALEKKTADVNALISVKKMESKLADEQAAADIYINPHDADLEYTTFGQWGSAGNEKAVRKMIEAGKFVDGTSANIEIPDILTDNDVYLALLSDWDKVVLKSNGHLTFTTNYPVIKDGAETGVKAEAGKRKGWNPDTAHCYFTDGSFVLIEQPENQNKLPEESAPYYNQTTKNYTTEQMTSYWSPSANVYLDEDSDNYEKYGCYDRMIIEKEGIVTLTDQILKMDENNRVAYIGFSWGAYPSMNSLGLGAEGDGFCGANDSDLNEMMTIMGNTDGHDYTNYCHPLWTLEKLLNGRADKDVPCYVIFISDGAPNKSTTYMEEAKYGWNLLEPMVDDNEGDYIGWYEILYGETSYTNSTAAAYVASQIKDKWNVPFYTVGFSTNADASALLESMASGEDSFFNCANVSEFMNKMQVVRQEIMTHYPSGILTDVIGEDFDLLVDSDHPFTIDGTGYASVEAAVEAGGVTVEGSALSWNLENVDEEGVQISFYVKLTDEELNKFENGTNRVYDTNADSKEATGANLEYHKLIVDSTKSEGYYAEEEATTVPMKTPQVKIWNGEVIPEDNNGGGGGNEYVPPVVKPEDKVPPTDNPPADNPPVDVPSTDVPHGGRVEDDPLFDLSDGEVPFGDRLEEDPAGVPKTGDPFTMWMFMSAVSGTCMVGSSILNYKKRDEE